jgi:hypothetical protein
MDGLDVSYFYEKFIYLFIFLAYLVKSISVHFTWWRALVNFKHSKFLIKQTVREVPCVQSLSSVVRFSRDRELQVKKPTAGVGWKKSVLDRTCASKPCSSFVVAAYHHDERKQDPCMWVTNQRKIKETPAQVTKMEMLDRLSFPFQSWWFPSFVFGTHQIGSFYIVTSNW